MRTQVVNGGTVGDALGHYDWRIPNINELNSIVEERCAAPAINWSVFPNASHATANGGSVGYYYCSSTPIVGISDNYLGGVWVLSLYNGDDFKMWKEGSYFSVRLVRDGQ